MRKIVLITTGQPSTNPRIVKEADTFVRAGFDVTVLYCFFINWAEEKDKELLRQVSWKYKFVGGSPATARAVYLYTRLRAKAAAMVSRFAGPGYLLAERSQARSYDELLREAKKIKADWYIAHNLGALPVAAKAARYNNAKAGFDFEDYHRGEVDSSRKELLKRIIYIENKYNPMLQYISTASSMITHAVQNDHKDFKKPFITLLNCFSLQQQPPFKEKKLTDTTLQLFWFSQTIGTGRGLEILISALQLIDDPEIRLTLAGRPDRSIVQYISVQASGIRDRIHFAGIIDPDKLPEFASRFDVGIAIEIPETKNRDICLTNKIFTYLLAGNAVICSETSMQLAFNRQYNIGESFKPGDVEKLAACIRAYKDIEKLDQQKLYNYQLAERELNWENEAYKLLEVVH